MTGSSSAYSRDKLVKRSRLAMTSESPSSAANSSCRSARSVSLVRMDVDSAIGWHFTGRWRLCRSAARTLDRDSLCRGLACTLLLLCLMVSGCALSRPEPMAPADFRLGGKIAVRGGAEAFSASFDWAQRGETYDVEFWGPLGQGRVRLRGDATRLTVTDSRGVTSAGISAGSVHGGSTRLGPANRGVAALDTWALRSG